MTRTLDDALGLSDGPEPEPQLRRIRGTPPHSTGSSGRRRRRRRSADKAAKRLDIQGLRTVAVVAVVINHLFGHPQGGFVGVDVFFVISGFLITGHLVREGGKGRISLVDFYRRRIRRLFPAALTVTALTVLCAWILFATERFQTTVVDALWATGFAANWRFLIQGSDYFQSYGPISPLRHYWSLSVEEQYYVVWPLVLILVFALVKKFASGREQAATVAGAVAAVVLVGGSLAVAAVTTPNDPVSAYFSTFSRGWELGLGSLLAVVSPWIKLNRRVATVLSWSGLAAIGVSFAIANESSGIPFPGALLPCLGSAAVLAAGCTKGVAPRVPLLTNRVSVYLGDVSYSIYVVHFPVIIFAGVLTRERGVGYYTAVLLFVFGISMLLYHLVEDPIRSSNWLKPKRERRRRRSVWPVGVEKFAVLACAVVFAAVSTYLLAVPSYTAAEQQQQIAAQLAAFGGSTMPGADPLGPQAEALAEQVRAAVLATSWPDLQPSLEKPEKVDNHECPRLGLLPIGECTWGNPDAAHTMYMIGDSTSGAYFAGIVGMIEKLPDWKVRVASGSGCGFGATKLNDAVGNWKASDCLPRNDQVVAEVNQVKPDVIVLTNHISEEDWTASEDLELAKMKGSFQKLVVLPAPPNTKAPEDCKTNISTPFDCLTPLPGDYESWMVNDNKLAQKWDGVFINPISWTCSGDQCPVFVGTTPMKKDSVHITDTFSRLLGPVLLEAFTETGVVS